MSKSLTLFDGVKADYLFDNIPGLTGYLNSVWRNRPLFLSGDENEDERRSTHQKFVSFSGNVIQPGKYIGFIQYEDCRINIYPRVFHNHPATNTSLIISHVLKWLSYGNRINFPFTEAPQQLQAQDDWLEALVFLFSNYTFNTLSSSPYFAYHELTEEMSFVRGRLAMQPYINQNLAKGRHHLVHCTYEPFLYDNQFNRIVKHTALLLKTVTGNHLNRQLLDDILFLLDEVPAVYCSAEDCARIGVNRLYPEVNIITNMCAAFLSNQVFAGGISSKQHLCILLPMELIFEQYVAGFIWKHFPPLGAIPQARDKWLAETGENFNKAVFQMRHDILIPGEMIIDTKYKFRKVSDDLKGGVNQNDLYQMVAYCYKRNIKKGMLLYPVHYAADAENRSYLFKVGDIIIRACSIDTVADKTAEFEKDQLDKFIELLKV
jgi:5-methylcytosine-specific restriction enzyme subunit McrC